MTGQSTAYLFSEIKRLIQLFRTLCGENRTFLSEPYSHSGLQSLIDNREYASSEVKAIESEIGDAFQSLFPEAKFSDLRDLTASFEKGSTEEQQILAELKAVLHELVDLNGKVEEFLMKQKTELAEVLKKLHQGSNMLKGYSQPGSTESCFIDKIK